MGPLGAQGPKQLPPLPPLIPPCPCGPMRPRKKFTRWCSYKTLCLLYAVAGFSGVGNKFLGKRLTGRP